MRSPVLLRLWLLIAIGAFYCSGGQRLFAQTIPLRYAQSYSAIRSVFSLPVSVAEREGFFRREGLDFKVVIPIPGGSDKMIDALNDGSADLTHIRDRTDF
jgi:ABC-type nitrate/sulfonate/bicarbonate transport system substrate-binding protein